VDQRERKGRPLPAAFLWVSEPRNFRSERNGNVFAICCSLYSASRNGDCDNGGAIPAGGMSVSLTPDAVIFRTDQKEPRGRIRPVGEPCS